MREKTFTGRARIADLITEGVKFVLVKYYPSRLYSLLNMKIIKYKLYSQRPPIQLVYFTYCTGATVPSNLQGETLLSFILTEVQPSITPGSWSGDRPYCTSKRSTRICTKFLKMLKTKTFWPLCAYDRMVSAGAKHPFPFIAEENAEIYIDHNYNFKAQKPTELHSIRTSFPHFSHQPWIWAFRCIKLVLYLGYSDLKASPQ